MTRAILICAVAFMAAGALSAADNSLADERYKAKYGRYPMGVAAAKQHEGPACCRSLAGHSAIADARDEEVRVKYGRFTPATETRLKAVGEDVARHQGRCLEMGQCSSTHAQEAVNVTAVLPAGEARFQAKYGRAYEAAVKPARVLAAPAACEHACCQSGS